MLVRHTSLLSCARAVFEEMNKTPKSLHDSDITRVRKHFMNGDGPAYRQTVVLSSLTSAEMNALLNRACSNWDGRVRLRVDHQVAAPPSSNYHWRSGSFLEILQVIQRHK